MNNFLDILKYLVYGMIVYILFTYVPQVKMPLSDVMVITIVIMMTYIFLDLLVPQRNLENFPQEEAIPEETVPEPVPSNLDNDSFSTIFNDINDNDLDVSGNSYQEDEQVDNTEQNQEDILAEILFENDIKNITEFMEKIDEDSLSELLRICSIDKIKCNNIIQFLKNKKTDGIITNNEFNKLVELLDVITPFEKLINELDLEESKKEEIITTCKFDKTECISKINILEISDEEKKILLDELDNMYNSEYILGITSLTEDEKQSVRDSCKDTVTKCSNKLDSFNKLNEDIKKLLLNSYNLIVSEENINISSTLPKDNMLPIITKLLNKYMSKDDIANIHNLCKDNSDKCTKKLDEMKLSGVLDNEAEILINVFYGLNDFLNLSSIIIDKKKLSKDQILELAYVCQKNIPLSMSTVVLNKFLSNKLITDNQSEDILSRLRILNTGYNILGSDIINKLIDDGIISTNEGVKLHFACSNNKNCLLILKQLEIDEKISNDEIKQILTSYNKYDKIEFDNKKFGSISNELGSMKKDNLKNLEDAYGESEMKYSQLDPNMHKPLGEHTNDFSNSFEYGYSYLNTNKWSVPINNPTACKTNDNCKVCASNTTGYPVNLKEWNSSRKIMPPDNINMEYINKLNQGK